MSYSRTIAVAILSAFLLALGVTALHVHAAHTDLTPTVTASADHGSDASCSFCSVIKTKSLATTNTIDRVDFTPLDFDVLPISNVTAASITTDRPIGRAPPEEVFQ